MRNRAHTLVGHEYELSGCEKFMLNITNHENSHYTSLLKKKKYVVYVPDDMSEHFNTWKTAIFLPHIL